MLTSLAACTKGWDTGTGANEDILTDLFSNRDEWESRERRRRLIKVKKSAWEDVVGRIQTVKLPVKESMSVIMITWIESMEVVLSTKHITSEGGNVWFISRTSNQRRGEPSWWSLSAMPFTFCQQIRPRPSMTQRWIPQHVTLQKRCHKKSNWNRQYDLGPPHWSNGCYRYEKWQRRMVNKNEQHEE